MIHNLFASLEKYYIAPAPRSKCGYTKSFMSLGEDSDGTSYRHQDSTVTTTENAMHPTAVHIFSASHEDHIRMEVAQARALLNRMSSKLIYLLLHTETRLITGFY